MSRRKTVVLGTRGSPLALAQTGSVLKKLQAKHPKILFKVIQIKTKGDKIKSAIQLRRAGKGVFVKEIEQALLKDKIDIAVHSMKDLPTALPEELSIGAILEREDPRDVFIGRVNTPLEKLAPGTVIGTASLRRQALLAVQYGSLRFVDLRGNVNTRLGKLADRRSRLGGIILAAAGLNRLYPQNGLKVGSLSPNNENPLSGLYIQPLPSEHMVPAPAQGAIGLETRADDAEIKKLIGFLHHEPTAATVAAERRLMIRLEGGCQIPLGVYAEIQEDGWMRLTAFLAAPDGSKAIRDEVTGSPDCPEELADALEVKLRNKGAGELLVELARGRR